MTKDKKYSPPKLAIILGSDSDSRIVVNNDPDSVGMASKENLRPCPSCELITLRGMPGGKDSTCKNCGYKDPCCYD